MSPLISLRVPGKRLYEMLWIGCNEKPDKKTIFIFCSEHPRVLKDFQVVRRKLSVPLLGCEEPLKKLLDGIDQAAVYVQSDDDQS